MLGYSAKEEVRMEKKYKATLHIVACLSGLAMGVAIGYWFNPSIGDFGDPSHGEAPALTRVLTYESYAWGPNIAYCNITVKNTQSPDLTITQVEVDNTAVTPNTPTLPYTLTKDSSVTIKVTSTFSSGTQYYFSVTTAKYEYAFLVPAPPTP